MKLFTNEIIHLNQSQVISHQQKVVQSIKEDLDKGGWAIEGEIEDIAPLELGS